MSATTTPPATAKAPDGPELRLVSAPTCADCEYFDNGAAGPDGHSDCLSKLSDRFQTYASSPRCKDGFWPNSTAGDC